MAPERSRNTVPGGQVYSGTPYIWKFIGPREKVVPRNAHRATSGVARPGGPSKGLIRLRILEALCWETSPS